MCAAKLLCFQAVSGFESHRLHHLKKAKKLPQKTPNCCQLLLPALLFFLALQHESFRICEEYSPWRTTRSSRASTPATEDFPSSTCSSRRLTGRFPLREQLTICGAAAARAPARRIGQATRSRSLESRATPPGALRHATAPEGRRHRDAAARARAL
jgi:hypothetical protein